MEQPQQPQQPQHCGHHVLSTPAWLLAIRLTQALLSIIVLGLAASIAHDAYLDELGLAIAVSIITVLVVGYSVVTEKAAICRPAYHVVAVPALDAFLVVLWLATFAAVAARRARFIFDVTVGGCYSNGDLFNSQSCLFKRGVVLFKRGGDMMSAASGIGALVWILFIVSFVWTLVHFLQGRKQGRFPLGTGISATAEPMAEQRFQAPTQQPQPNGQFQGQSLAPQLAQSPFPHSPPHSPSPPAAAYSCAENQQQPHLLHGQCSSPPQGSQSQPHAYQQSMGSELLAQHPPQTHPHQ